MRRIVPPAQLETFPENGRHDCTGASVDHLQGRGVQHVRAQQLSSSSKHETANNRVSGTGCYDRDEIILGFKLKL